MVIHPLIRVKHSMLRNHATITFAFGVSKVAQARILQPALPAGKTIKETPKGERDAAWKKVCQRVKDALIAREKPVINAALEGKNFPRMVQDLQVLSRPATRRTEVFIRADRSDDWYHQGP